MFRKLMKNININKKPIFIFYLQFNFPHLGLQRPWQKIGHAGSMLFKQNCTLISAELFKDTKII